MANDFVPTEDLPDSLVPTTDLPTEAPVQDPVQARQQAAIQEPAFQGLARATIPTIAGVATMGVANPLAAGGLMAGATRLNQLLRREQPDVGEVALAGAIPPAVSGAVKGGLTGAKILGQWLAPAATREAATEAAALRIGLPATTLERATQTPASEALFQATKQIGAIPTAAIKNTVDDAIQEVAGMANVNTRGIKYLSNLSRKFATKPVTDYSDVVRELQAMRGEAEAARGGLRPDLNRARALEQARWKIIDDLDNISPALKAANQQYRLEESGQELVKAMRAATPNVAVRQLLETNKLVSGAFDKTAKADILKIVDSITGISEGAPQGFLLKLIEPLGNAMTNPTGRKFLRYVLTQPGAKTPARLAAALQFARAYRANPYQEQPQ